MPSLPVQVIYFDLGDTLVLRSGDWVDGAQSVLDELAAAGLRLGILSNTGNLSREELLAALPAGFDLTRFKSELIILSSEVGIEKPSRAIFELAVSRAEVEAAACLYCSENLVETLAAQEAGLRAARLLRPPASDLRELAESLRQGRLLA